MTTTRTVARVRERAKRDDAQDQARHGAFQHEPEITRIDISAKQIERRGDQAKNAGKNECGSDGFARGQVRQSTSSAGTVKAAAADAGQADSECDEKTEKKMH